MVPDEPSSYLIEDQFCLLVTAQHVTTAGFIPLATKVGPFRLSKSWLGTGSYTDRQGLCRMTLRGSLVAGLMVMLLQLTQLFQRFS